MKFGLETTEQRSMIMKAIKGKDTQPEITLRKLLWNRGYRYRKNYKIVFGTPDIVFVRLRIAIFIDSEFFHGYNWEEKKLRLKSNREYWINKIERNMKRDKIVNEYLLSKGWKVLRFWAFEVKKNPLKCLKQIEYEVGEMKSKIFYR